MHFGCFHFRLCLSVLMLQLLLHYYYTSPVQYQALQPRICEAHKLCGFKLFKLHAVQTHIQCICSFDGIATGRQPSLCILSLCTLPPLPLSRFEINVACLVSFRTARTNYQLFQPIFSLFDHMNKKTYICIYTMQKIHQRSKCQIIFHLNVVLYFQLVEPKIAVHC